MSATAWISFSGVLGMAGALALSALWMGLSFIWLGIALAIIGPLAVALVLNRDDLKGAPWASSLGEIVRLRRFWVMVVVSVSINICWHFLVNWIPTVLKEERGLTYMTGNFVSAIPFLLADVGNLAGGWFSRRLSASGRSAERSRQMVMSVCIVPIVAGVGVSVAPSNVAAVVLLSLMAAGTAAFMVNYFAFAQEVSSVHTGLVVGYLGGIGNLFVAGFQPFAGKVKDITGSFSLVFLLIGVAPLIGLAMLWWGWRDQPVEPPGVLNQIG